MPSWDHEGLIELFRSDPRLAGELLESALGVALPSYTQASVEPNTMAELKPAELLVITQSAHVATWASKPIVLGPGGCLQPLVVAPAAVPIVDDAAEARRAPELAVLSAMVHGGGDVPTAVSVALAASIAAHELPRDRFVLYFGLIRAALSEAARKVFEMSAQNPMFFDEAFQRAYEQGLEAGIERGIERGIEQGVEKARAALGEALLELLEQRGISVTSAHRERVSATRNVEALQRWIRRANSISSAAELFDEEKPPLEA